MNTGDTPSDHIAAPTSYTREQVMALINKAADMLGASSAFVDHPVDATACFLVNAMGALLDDPDASARDALTHGWGTDGDTVTDPDAEEPDFDTVATLRQVLDLSLDPID